MRKSNVFSGVSKQLSVALCATLFVGSVQAATPPPALAAAPLTPAATAVIHLNPESLRWYLMNNNTSVLNALNAVYQAKVQVSRARANLLPSLSLSGGIASALTSPASFALSSVSILLPFLLPSNWFNLKTTKHQLAANGYSYYIVELNTYASILSLYTTIIGDIELQSVYEDRTANLKQIEDLVNNEVLLGSATEADLAQARSQTQLARVQTSQVVELINQERASIRHMLNLPLSQPLVFDKYHYSPNVDENTNAQVLLERVLPTSPEERQVESLIAAAKPQKWAAIFGFFNSASLVGTPSGGSGGNSNTSGSIDSSGVASGVAAAGATSAGGSGNIGLAQFRQTDSITLSPATIPTVALTNLQVAALQIQQMDVRFQEGSVLESTLGSITETKIQVTQATRAEANADIYYQSTLNKYSLGRTDLLHVFAAANDALNASVTRVRARIDLDNQRVNLNRILITNHFTAIPTCQLKGSERTGGILGFLEDVGRPQKHVSIDQVCKPAAAAALVAGSVQQR